MPRPEPPPIPQQGDERATLQAFLDYYRAALIDRTWDLGTEELQQSHQPSSLTLSRLMGHMTWVEYTWFRERFDGAEMPEPWASLDWEADRDAEMTLAQTLGHDELKDRLRRAIDDSNARIAKAETLDLLSARSGRDGQPWNLRWILVHMIEEYARHTGHADLIREAIDGNTAS